MKRLIISLILTILFCFGAFAQRQFDSVAYSHSINKNFALLPTKEIDGGRKLSAEQKIEGLSKVWYEAKFNFANFDLVPNLNWDSLYRAFIPKALKAITVGDYYRVLKNFNQYLHDGHSKILEPASAQLEYAGEIPLQFKLIDNKIVLSKIEGPLKKQKIKLGWVLEKINDVPVNIYVKKYISPYINYSTPQDSIAKIYCYELLKGRKRTSVILTFRDTSGKIMKRTFKRSDHLASPEIEFKLLPDNIGYIAINTFNTEQVVKAFDSLFTKLTDTKSLIIDIRSNGGGSSLNGYEILGFLVDRPFQTDRSILRTYSPVNRSWNDDAFSINILHSDWKPYRHKFYNKPIVLLTSAATYSASEDFVSAFKAAHIGTIIGETTGGSSGQPLAYSLPGGGIGFICCKRECSPTGQEFIGKGILPDIAILYTIKEITKGKDEAIIAAQRFLKNP